MPKYIFDNNSNPYMDLPSLADSKKSNLLNKLAGKQERLTPTPVPVEPLPTRIFSDGASGDGLIDMAEASLYRGAGNIADTYANIQQNALDNPNYALSPEIDNLSDQAYSDEKAGFTGREAYNEDIHKLTNAVNKGGLAGYSEAAMRGLALGPRALADSAASGVELGVGALATAAAGAATGPVGAAIVGAAAFGSKAKKVVDAVDKVVTLGDRLKKGAKAVPALIAKSAGRTSLLTADITEQMRQEYKEANGGKEPSAAWYATNVPVTMALNAVEFGIITKAVPKFSKSFVKDMKHSVKFMSNSHALEAAKRIFGGIKKVTAAAGAEAGQEYLQTWHEILAPVVSGKSLEKFVTTAAQALGNDQNQTEAIVGSILGFSAGGTARGIATVPQVSAGVALEGALGTAKTAGEGLKAANRGIQNATNKAGLKVLSEDDRANIRNDYDIAEKIVEEKSAEIDTKIEVIKDAKTLEDLAADKDLNVTIGKAMDELGFLDGDLKDPAKFKKLQDKIIRNQAAAKDLLKVELETSNASAVVKASTTNIKNMTVEAAKAAIDKVPKEVVEATVAAAIKAKAIPAVALKSVQQLRSSSAYGIVEIGLKGTVKQSKIAYEAAKDLSHTDIQKVADIVMEKNPDLGKKLNKLYEDKKKAYENFDIRNKDLINAENLPAEIKEVAKNGTIGTQSAAGIAKLIKHAMGSKIADKATLDILSKAVAAYKKSDAYTNTKTKGRIDERNMAVLENRLTLAKDRLGREVTTENVKEAVDTVVDKVTKSAEKVVDKAKSVAKNVTSNEKVKAAAVKVTKAVDSVTRESKEIAPGKLHDVISNVATSVTNGNIDEMITAIPAFVKKLASKGYETEADFNDLIAQFPGLKTADKFYNELKSKFAVETDVIMSEDSDSIQTDPVSPNVVFQLFEKLIPGCKK